MSSPKKTHVVNALGLVEPSRNQKKTIISRNILLSSDAPALKMNSNNAVFVQAPEIN